MTKKQIHQEIRIVLSQMGIPVKAITKNASYYKDLELDSLDFVEMLMEFEVRWNIALNSSEMENIKTVQETVEYVSQLKN